MARTRDVAILSPVVVVIVYNPKSQTKVAQMQNAIVQKAGRLTTRQNRRTAKKAHTRSTTRTETTSFRSQIRIFTIRTMKVIMDQPVAIQKKPTTKQPSKKMRDLTQTQRKRIIHGTGEGGNDAAPSLKIGEVKISSKAACDGTCADKKCPAAQHYTRALMEWLDTLVSSSKDETSGTSESPENGAAEMRRTYENDIREAYNAMQRKLTDDDDGMLVDSGSNIHFLTLEDARKYFMSRRSTQLRVLGINGVRERCKAEGEIEMLVRDHLGKQLHLSLGTGYTSGKIPKSLLSASRLMASGAILHFEKGASYMELPRFKSRIDLVEKKRFVLHSDR